MPSLLRAGSAKRSAHPALSRKPHARLLALIVTVVLAACLYRAGYVAWLHVQSPGPLALENPAIAAILLLKGGGTLYSSENWTDLPLHIQMYPPLYHYLVATLPNWATNPYLIARSVSALSMVGTALLLLAVGKGRTLWPSGAMLAAVYLSLHPVATNTFFARQDPLALLLSVSSIVALLRWPNSTRVVAMAAALSVLALATKQSFVAAPLTCLFFLFLTDRRCFYVYASAFFGLSACVVLAAQLLWGTDFWLSNVGTLLAGLQAENLFILPAAFFSQATASAVILLAAMLLWASRSHTLAGSGRSGVFDLTTVYMLTSSVICLFTLPKAGASLNYFFEPAMATLLFIQQRLTALNASGSSEKWILGAATGFLVAIAIDVGIHPVPPAFTSPGAIDADKGRIERVASDLDELSAQLDGRPVHTILLPPNDRNLLPNLGLQPLVSDPFLYHVLIEQGALDPDLLSRPIENRSIDVVALPVRAGTDPHALLNDVFFASLTQNYAEVTEGAYRYFVPRER